MRESDIIVEREIDTRKEASEKLYKNARTSENRNEHISPRSFDKFKTYNNTKLKKEYEKYEVRKRAAKPIPKSDFDELESLNKDYVPMKESLIYKKKLVSEKVPFTFSPRGKIALVTFGFIFTILSSVAIFNALTLNSLGKDLSHAESLYNGVFDNVQKLANDVDDLSDITNPSGDGFIDVGEIIEVDTYEIKNIRTFEKQNNFYDSITDFLKNMFSL